MAAVQQATSPNSRVSSNEPTYGQIVDFLIDEAYLLDGDKHIEWVNTCLTDDVRYVSHKRKTVYRKQGDGIRFAGGEFNDDKRTMLLRAKRNTEVPSAFDRDPPPRICRVVGNVVVHMTDKPDEYAVRSRILLYRNRFDDTTYDMITAVRDDVIRFTDQGPKLASRTITPEMSRLPAPFPNVFM